MKRVLFATARLVGNLSRSVKVSIQLSFAGFLGWLAGVQPKCSLIAKGVSSALIIGNGPGFEGDRSRLRSGDYECVLATNSFAATSYFQEIKPTHYILQDSYWFEDPTKRNSKARTALESLVKKTTWTIQLFVPAQFQTSNTVKELSENPFLTINPMHQSLLPSAWPFLGSTDLRHTLRGGNILLLQKLWTNRLLNVDATGVASTALFELILANVKRIDLVGVDMSMALDLRVSPSGQVGFFPSHFYGTAQTPQPALSGGAKSTMAEEYRAVASKFTTFDLLADFAYRRGIEVTNLSDRSLLDSFPRRGLSLQ